ncbi:MAG TPA: ABC transporter substrate-binding protein [Conexibacter sp.]|nr:ABC transporter substrate-binding protein [Conexibacter sp.]
MAYSSEADDLRPSEAAVERARRAATSAGLTRQAFLRRSAGSVLGVTSLAAFLTACGSAGTAGTGSAAVGSPPAHPTGTLRIALPGAVDSLDPTIAESVGDLAIITSIFESLVTFDAGYRALAPSLATRWHVSDDAREWVFTLRDGVRFHDGATFDASAVRKNFEYVLRPSDPYGFLFGTPVIDDSDPSVVRFTYKTPFPDLGHNLTLASGISSPKVLGSHPAKADKQVARQHVGTGPFRFVSERAGQSVTLAAFDGHWGEKPHIETLVFNVIPEESARVSALQAGDVDLVLQVAPLAARSLRSDPRLAVHESPSWSTACLMPVCDMKPFDDPRVRQAMAYAIDRKTIVEKLLLGTAALDDSMFPPGIQGYHVPATAYAHDPQKARQLLKDAGYGGTVPVRMSVRSDAVLASEISQALVAQLNAVGFATTSEVLDPAVFEADKSLPRPKYQLHWNEWGWVTGGPFHLTLGALAAQCHYRNPRYDALVARVVVTPDGRARERLIADAIDVWANDVAWITLWVPKRLDASIATLQHYQAPPNVFTKLGTSYISGSA